MRKLVHYENLYANVNEVLPELLALSCKVMNKRLSKKDKIAIMHELMCIKSQLDGACARVEILCK